MADVKIDGQIYENVDVLNLEDTDGNEVRYYTDESLRIDYSTQVTGKPKINGVELDGDISLEQLGISSEKPAARIAYVNLLASAWVGEESPYSQIVDIDGVTENSQVDLTPSVEQLSVFYNKDLAFVAHNTNGVVTVYAIGQKPANDYVIQVTLTEVYR